MGKYGIGTRILDRDGDAATIIDKRKGERRLQYDDPELSQAGWFTKSWIDKVDDTPPTTASARPELCEIEYSVGDRVVVVSTTYDADYLDVGQRGTVVTVESHYIGVEMDNDDDVPKNDWAFYASELAKSPAVAPATAWEPKVGDRVRDGEGGPDATISAVRADGQFSVNWDNGQVGVFFWRAEDWTFLSRPEPVVPTPLTIEAGRYYRTRDGRKVGPVRVFSANEMVCEVAGSDEGAGQRIWTLDGKHIYGISAIDLVALWADEPVAAPPVAVAEATATPPTAWQAATEEPETPAPAPKFKVGDRVKIVTHGKPGEDDDSEWKDLSVGSEHTITGKAFDGVNWTLSGSGARFWLPNQLELTPTPTPGSTVTFTATGRVSAVNDNGHIQLVFKGLPAGRNSFALPAALLA